MTERIPDSVAANALLADFKAHIRVTANDLDADLRQKMMAAVLSVERHIGRVILKSRFVTTTVLHTLQLHSPVTEVEGVEIDGAATQAYTVRGNVLKLDEGVTAEQMKVTYDAGGDYIPYDIKAAVLMQAATLFNNPADHVELLVTASQNLLRPYRKWGMNDGELD